MNTLQTTPLVSAVQAFALPKDAPGAARTTLKLLLRLKHGTLTVHLPGGSVQRFGSGQAPLASLNLHNWNACSAALRSGDIGFAESYIAGDWTTPNLSDLLQVLIANRNEVEDVIYGSWLGRFVYRVKHLLNRNTKANSQKNIHAHYDLGNAFYELWLDGTMNYSSAIFEKPGTSMKDAQNAKVRRALNMARVKPGDRVLEIGCGWGALAEMATTEFDASLVGVTLSTEQLAWAQARIARLGVPCSAGGSERSAGRASEASSAASEGSDVRAATSVGACDLRLQDYRDIGKVSADEPFDAICSIEMVEAVGREYWPEYFQTVARLLKPGGRFVLHVHNRSFRGLGWRRVVGDAVKAALKRPDAGDVTMPQAYAGAPLTLHHFTRRGAVELLEAHGLRVLSIHAVSVDGRVRPAGWPDALSAYGYLLIAERATETTP